MHLDLERIQIKIERIIEEYLLNISSLADHNHFRTGSKSVRSPERGFDMLTRRNQYVLDEEHFLEGCTRVFLINPIIRLFLDAAEIRNDWRYGTTFGEYTLSNREYELSSFVEFVFERDGKNIGCKYTRSTYRGHETASMERDTVYLFKHKPIPGFEHLTHVDEVWSIDWTNERSSTEKTCFAPGMVNLNKNIAAKEFFEALFSADLYELFVAKTRVAINQAQNIIALEATPQLMPNNILAFKNFVIEELSEKIFANHGYAFSRKRYIGLPSSLTEDDHAIITEAFFKNGYRYALIGNSDFAQSFITSEYLFRTIKSGLSIDYTSVVVGYLKSVEQLLYALYISAFKGADGMCYWDTCSKNKNHFDPALPQYRYDPYDEQCFRMQEKYYHRKRVGTAAPEIGMLAQFLRYYDACWNISETGKEYVCACLDDFRACCRNHHFHKDNIGHDKYEKVKLIRNNTIVCLYYLLGAFKFLDENISINEQLGIMNYDFENLYRTIWEKHRRLFWISSVDGYSGIAYYSGFFTPCGFDSSGKLLNAQLYFVKFPDMDRSNAFIEDILCKLDDVEYVHSNTLTVTQDCMPIEILPLLPPKKKRMK